MAFDEGYGKQVGLLVRVLPLVMADDRFALKGGTAINLFVRDLPRLSVDIDLTWLPLQPRDEARSAIDLAMREAAARIKKGVRGARIDIGRDNTGLTTKLNVFEGRTTQVKIEINTVTRGFVFPPELRSVSERVEAEFGFAEAQIVSFADLYAGKIVAALDRQHPRDLFDVRDLLAAEGISDDLRRAFLVYMMSHDRPLHEVLAPERRDLSEKYEREFVGMTADVVMLAELEAIREEIIDLMVRQMPQQHRDLLNGFKRGEPDWSILDIEHAPTLPGVRWKQQNLDRLPPKKRADLIAALEDVLRGGKA